MLASLPLVDPITAGWLTAALGEAGILQQGTVTKIESEQTNAFNSVTSHLFVQYSDDATSVAPTRLILKRNRATSQGIEDGIEEVKFYTLIASLPEYPPIMVPCYAAAYDETSGNSYLLLQDLSTTHRPPLTRDQQIGLVESVPSAADLAAVVETLARLHAYWWEHPLLATDRFVIGYWSRTRDRFEAYLQRRTNSWHRLMAQEGDTFPADLRALYERVLARLPQYWEKYLAPRFRNRQRLTLIHGDSYFVNFLCAKPPASGPTYILDWQSPGFDIGGYDLANLCAPFWTPEQRRENQREVLALRRYHATLQTHGVKDYTWDDLVIDYQIGLIFLLLMPVQDGADGSRKDYWWPKMQCLVAAFQDWRCEALLETA